MDRPLWLRVWSSVARLCSSITLMIGQRGMQRGLGEEEKRRKKKVKPSCISDKFCNKRKKEGRRLRIMRTLGGKYGPQLCSIHLATIHLQAYSTLESALNDHEKKITVLFFNKPLNFYEETICYLQFLPLFNYRWESVANVVTFKLYLCHLPDRRQICTFEYHVLNIIILF